MSKVRFIVKNPDNQATLDRANDAYLAVALENNGYRNVDADKIYEALMSAWEFISEVAIETEVEDD